MTLALLPLQSVRTIARLRGIDLPQLIDILSLRRPDQSETENQFVIDYLDIIPGMGSDEFGNRFMTIGDKPTVMWSCHTDTVSDEGGRQNVKWAGDNLILNEPKRGQTLGADDGAGLWLMLEMIKESRPGLYIFHRAEEVGGLGSKDIAKNRPEMVDGIQMAIAFDRKALTSVITYQRGMRCCSDNFAIDLADALGLGYKIDEGGVFTDTASYTGLIAECTNLSAGYYDEHTSSERLDVAHLLKLRDALLVLDVSLLRIERDPTKVERRSYSGYDYGSYSGYGGWSGNGQSSFSQDDDIEAFIKTYPYGVAKWMRQAGLTASMLEKLVYPDTFKNKHLVSVPKKEWTGPLAEKFPEEDEVDDGFEIEIETEQGEALYCNDCEEVTAENEFRAFPIDGEACPHCQSNNTSVIDIEVDPATGEMVYA